MVHGYRIPAGQMVFMHNFIGGRDDKWIGKDPDRQGDGLAPVQRGAFGVLGCRVCRPCSSDSYFKANLFLNMTKNKICHYKKNLN